MRLTPVLCQSRRINIGTEVVFLLSIIYSKSRISKEKDINEYEGSFFFWLAKKRTDIEQYKHGKEKLIIWLNGGPGCSSMVGMMWEVMEL